MSNRNRNSNILKAIKYLTVIKNYKVIIGMTALKMKYTRVQLNKGKGN